MALFSEDNNPPRRVSLSSTVISKEMEVKGDFKGKGAIQVEGVLYGNISVDSVVVAKDGEVYGNINAINALILGKVVGEIEILKKLDIESTGDINGKIKLNTLVIAEGAKVIGSIEEIKPTSNEKN